MTIEPRPGVPVPPDDVIDSLREGAPRNRDCGVSREIWLAKQGAAWGAEEQLRLCVEWLTWVSGHCNHGKQLHAAMRPEPPKPPTLKEQALDALNGLYRYGGSAPTCDIIRRALETLP